VLAAIVLPVAFAVAAWAAPSHGYVAVAWAWAVAYPIAFAVLLSRALVRCHVALATYLRQLAGVVACGAAAAVGAIAVHEVLPARPLLRLLAVAAAVLAIDGLLLARIEKVTPRSILRALRGAPEP